MKRSTAIAIVTAAVLMSGCMTYWENTDPSRNEFEFNRDLPIDLEACERQYQRSGSAIAQTLILGSSGIGSEQFVTDCMKRKGYRRVEKDEYERRTDRSPYDKCIEDGMKVHGRKHVPPAHVVEFCKETYPSTS